jgi:hypothetical protein
VGPTGPRGPSDAYDGFKYPGNNTLVTGTDAARTRVLAFNLPAGSFAITSKVNLSAGTTGGGLVHCVTQTPTGYYDMGVASIGPNAGETLENTESTTFTAVEVNPASSRSTAGASTVSVIPLSRGSRKRSRSRSRARSFSGSRDEGAGSG